MTEQCCRRLREIDVDPAAGADGGAGEQRGGDGLERVNPGRHVGDGGADPMRNLVVAEIDRHQAGKSLRDRIRARTLCIRTVLPKTADREVDQTRIVLRQGFVADPEPCRDAGPETFDQDVAG